MLTRKLTIVAAFAGLVTTLASARGALVTTPIAVYNSTTSALVGYVSDTYDGQNSFTYTTSLAGALQVQIDTSASSPISILEMNPPGPNHNFGAVGGSGSFNFAAGGGGYAYLSGTALTAAGATPQSVATDINSLGYDGPAESTIWSLTGNVLTAQWVNANSTTSATQTFYDPVVNYVGIVGDLPLYNSTYGDNAYAVTFVATGVPVPEPASLAAIGIPVAVSLLRRRRTAA
jgi:hypothetical protein